VNPVALFCTAPQFNHNLLSQDHPISRYSFFSCTSVMFYNSLKSILCELVIFDGNQQRADHFHTKMEHRNWCNEPNLLWLRSKQICGRKPLLVQNYSSIWNSNFLTPRLQMTKRGSYWTQNIVFSALIHKRSNAVLILETDCVSSLIPFRRLFSRRLSILRFWPSASSRHILNSYAGKSLCYRWSWFEIRSEICSAERRAKLRWKNKMKF
jgi:hypothetical protein